MHPACSSTLLAAFCLWAGRLSSPTLEQGGTTRGVPVTRVFIGRLLVSGAGRRGRHQTISHLRVNGDSSRVCSPKLRGAEGAGNCVHMSLPLLIAGAAALPSVAHIAWFRVRPTVSSNAAPPRAASSSEPILRPSRCERRGRGILK